MDNLQVLALLFFSVFAFYRSHTMCRQWQYDSLKTDDPVDDFLILKRTSVLYYFIYNLQCSPVAFIKTKLEKDLNIHIRDQLRHSILGQVYNISVCVRNMLIQFKIMGSTGPGLSWCAYMQRWTQPVEGVELLLVHCFTCTGPVLHWTHSDFSTMS